MIDRARKLQFIPARGADGWGIVLLHNGEAIDHWSPAQARAQAADLDAKAKLCKRPGLIPA